MSSKHTQGPWIFYADTPSTEPNWHIVTTANRQRVIANIHIQPGSAMDTANARLIAAAPELLENLIGCVEALASHVPDCIEVQCARAAIAKTAEEAACAS